MDYNFSPLRLLILAASIVAFWLLDGFTVPVVNPARPGQFTKAWSYCVLLYGLGAICVSVVDHYVGLIDRKNIRALYIVLGLGLMAGSCFWLRSLRGTPVSTE